MLDMTNDHLIDRLQALCRRFADTALDGRYEVANRADLSEQYLYQILAGKPMSNGSRRSVGKMARAKLSRAFPDWLDAPATVAPNKAGEPSPVAYFEARKTDPIIDQVVTMMLDTDSVGRAMVLAAAKIALTGYTPAAKNRSSS